MNKVLINSDRPTKDVLLPSSGGTITLYSELLAGDIENFVGKKVESLSGEDTFQLIVRMIKDWNLYKNENEKLEITIESIRLLPSKDLKVLIDSATEIEKDSVFDEDQKKNTTTSSS